MLVANILCHNERHYLENLIPHVASFCDRIIVVDDCSTDGTAEFLATWPMVTRIERKFDLNFSNQRNAALDLVANGDWVFRIDADEVVTDDLARDLKATIAHLDANGVDRLQMPIYHLISFGLCKQEIGVEIRLFKKNETCHWAKQFHEEIQGLFPGGLLRLPGHLGLIHFKYMDAQRIQYTRDFFLPNGLYDPEDLERRIHDEFSFLPPVVKFTISDNLRCHLASNPFFPVSA